MKRPQFLPPRLLCRVLRAGWGPVPPQPPSRLVRVKYPAALEPRCESVVVGYAGDVYRCERVPDHQGDHTGDDGTQMIHWDHVGRMVDEWVSDGR